MKRTFGLDVLQCPRCSGDAKGEAEQVSNPEEPAEKEADAVADDVTEGLHEAEQGKDEKKKKKGEEGPDAEEADEKPATRSGMMLLSGVDITGAADP